MTSNHKMLRIIIYLIIALILCELRKCSAKMLENSHAWMGGGSSGPASTLTDSYQYQLQSMWQKCWNTNQNLMHHLRFRERGPLKSWRPETMAEAIFSVLKEGLSLSQAARKYDIPYPTFVLYANRVHNMLGPSIDGGPDLRPKGRGRPQRILLGIWPDEHIKGVIKTVVFRDAKDLKDDSGMGGHGMPPYGRHSPVFPFQDMPMNYPGAPTVQPGGPCPNGIPTPTGDQMSQEATAAAVAAVAHNIRQQMQMAAAVQHSVEGGPPPGLFNLPPHLQPPPPHPGGPGGIPLPKASISPALSSGSNPAVGPLGPRHAPSPCGPGVGIPGLPPNIPPSMAVALSRCDPTALLSQQQQHQLQQLHLQQQHALQQQQQQQHKTGFGASSMPHPSTSTSSSAAASTSIGALGHHHHQQHHQQHHHQQQQLHHHQHQQQQHHHHLAQQQQQLHQQSSSLSSASSSSADKSKALSTPERRHSSETPHMHSPLTELGLELGYKREYSPTRLFADDLSELVGGVSSATSSSSGAVNAPNTVTAAAAAASSSASIVAPTTSLTSASSAATLSSSISSSSGAVGGGGGSSNNNIKVEPISTSGD